MTDESKSETDAWIEDTGAKFAYGYSGELKRKVGVSSLPTAMLVSPAGMVVYNGSPTGITDALIEQHLDGALSLPVWDWPKEASKAKKSLMKDRLAKAIEAAEELAQDGVENGDVILKDLRALAASRAKAVVEAAERGDFYTVYTTGRDAERSLKGLPEEEQVEEAIKASKTSAAKRVIKAQRMVRKVLDDVAGARRAKDFEEAIETLEKIAAHNEGNYAATEANRHVARLKERLSRMKR